MRRAAFLPALLASWLCWSGCSQAPDTEGPRQALDRYFAAARADDWQAFYQVVDSGYRAGRTPEEFATWARSATPGFARAITARSTYEVISVELDGDRASIKLSMQVPDLQAIPDLQGRLPSEAEVLAAPLIPTHDTFDLLREEGDWRIILAPPSEPDRELQERVERAASELNPPSKDPSEADRGR